MATAWDDVVMCERDAGPLLTHRWLCTTMRTLSGPSRQYLTYVARRATDVVAIGAFVRCDGRCRTLQFAGGFLTDAYGLAHRPGEEAAATAVVREALCDCQPVDRVVLTGVAERLTMGVLPLAPSTSHGDHRAVAVFPPSGWAEYEEAVFSSRFKRELRRQRRRLDALGRVDLHREEKDLAGALRSIGRLNIARSADRYTRSYFGRPTLVLLRAQMATAAENRSLAVYELRLDGEPIAAILTFELGKGSWVTHLGFDPTYRSYGPGILLQTYMLRDLADRGMATVDFGMGDLPYKRKLGNHTEPWFAIAGHPRGQGSLLRWAASRLSEQVRFTVRRSALARRVWLRRAGREARLLQYLEDSLAELD